MLDLVNAANEIGRRDFTIGGSPVSTGFRSAVYDDVGNMTNDAVAYKYTYDVFGRITEVRARVTPGGTSDLRARYRYNGLHQRTVWREDRDGTAGLDDVEYHHVYDDRWRTIAVYRKVLTGTPTRDADPKEVTVYHAAGLDGRGGSSKLDSVIARYRHDDGNTSTSPAEEWADAAGTLGSRGIYFQNWRGDVTPGRPVLEHPHHVAEHGAVVVRTPAGLQNWA